MCDYIYISAFHQLIHGVSSIKKWDDEEEKDIGLVMITYTMTSIDIRRWCRI